MMDFSRPAPRRSTESVVPMINVVFLLLIFFLMTSSLSVPEPIDVEPPVAQGEEAGNRVAILYLGADGTLAFGEARGDTALAEFARQATKGAQLRADARVKAAKVAQVLRQLAVAGLTRVDLVAVPS